LPYDNVDQDYINRPQILNVSLIRNYMIAFGPVSSIFDFLTFAVMIFIFKAGPALFQTAWFIESLFTQTLVIFAIRTHTVPFFKSKPSRILLFNVIIILAIAIALPYFAPVAHLFGFVKLPGTFILILAAFIVIYMLLVELVKVWFYRRYAPEGMRK